MRNVEQSHHSALQLMFISLIIASVGAILAVLYLQYCRVFRFLFNLLLRTRKNSRRYKEVSNVGPTLIASGIRPFALDGIRNKEFREYSSSCSRSESRQMHQRSRKYIRSKSNEEICKKLGSLRAILSCGIDHEPIEILDELSRS